MQLRQGVEIGKVMVAGTHMIVLDGQGAQMQAGAYQLPLELGRPAIGRIVEGKGGNDLALGIMDRTGPAGAEAKRQSQGLVVRPEGIGGNIGDNDGLVPPGSRAA